MWDQRRGVFVPPQAAPVRASSVPSPIPYASPRASRHPPSAARGTAHRIGGNRRGTRGRKPGMRFLDSDSIRMRYYIRKEIFIIFQKLQHISVCGIRVPWRYVCDGSCRVYTSRSRPRRTGAVGICDVCDGYEATLSPGGRPLPQTGPPPLYIVEDTSHTAHTPRAPGGRGLWRYVSTHHDPSHTLQQHERTQGYA